VLWIMCRPALHILVSIDKNKGTDIEP